MVNNTMKTDNQKSPDTSATSVPSSKPSRPNESGTLHIDAHVKIFDPNTLEVILEKRA